MVINKSQCDLLANVYITVTNEVTHQSRFYYGKNQVTKSMLYGVGNFLSGSLRNNPDLYDRYIPHSVGFGTGTNPPQPGDTGLESVEGIEHTSIDYYSSSEIRGELDSTQAVFRAYIPAGTYAGDNISLSEVGLFGATGELLARTLIKDESNNPGTITQGTNEIIDVQWTIKLTSIGDTETINEEA